MIIFDKSALQSFSIDESVWLEHFFLANITPLFYIESLADLNKDVRDGRTPEQVVGNLAEKTPILGSFSNGHYFSLAVNNLLGFRVDMKGRPYSNKQGQYKKTADGKIGIYYEQQPEEKALQRWEKKEFLEIEHEFARQWREALINISFEFKRGIVKNIVPSSIHFSNLQDIKNFTSQFVAKNDKEILLFTLEFLDIPGSERDKILNRWENAKRPSLNEFAPYASYVLEVDLLFYLGLNSSFISKERPSNKIDVAYLYYLPFTMVFVSKDKLHERTAPLFMTDTQTYIKSDDLKTSLKEIDEYYLQFAEEIKKYGILSFAEFPPPKSTTVIGELWDKMHGKGWRKAAEKKETTPFAMPGGDLAKKILERDKNAVPFMPDQPMSSDDADHILIKRTTRAQKGKWRIVPEGIENE